MNKQSPCNGCVPPKRWAACHSTCPEYLKWSNERQQALAKIRDIHNAENDCFPNSLRGNRRRRKR